jgi:hypothetical protein
VSTLGVLKRSGMQIDARIIENLLVISINYGVEKKTLKKYKFKKTPFQSIQSKFQIKII